MATHKLLGGNEPRKPGKAKPAKGGKSKPAAKSKRPKVSRPAEKPEPPAPVVKPNAAEPAPAKEPKASTPPAVENAKPAKPAKSDAEPASTEKPAETAATIPTCDPAAWDAVLKQLDVVTGAERRELATKLDHKAAKEHLESAQNTLNQLLRDARDGQKGLPFGEASAAKSEPATVKPVVGKVYDVTGSDGNGGAVSTKRVRVIHVGPNLIGVEVISDDPAARVVTDIPADAAEDYTWIEVVPSDAWRHEPVSVLGMSERINEAFAAKNLKTIGDIADFTKDGWTSLHRDLPGVGPGNAEKIEDALLEFHRRWAREHKADAAPAIADESITRPPTAEEAAFVSDATAADVTGTDPVKPLASVDDPAAIAEKLRGIASAMKITRESGTQEGDKAGRMFTATTIAKAGLREPAVEAFGRAGITRLSDLADAADQMPTVEGLLMSDVETLHKFVGAILTN